MRFACALAVFSAHSALSAPAAAQREIQTISTIGRYRTPGTRAVGDAIVRVTREAPVAKAAWNAVQVRAYNAVNVEPQVKSLAGSLATAREANKFNVQTAREALDLALVFCVSKDSRYYGHAMSRLRLFRTAFNPAVELPAIQTNHQYHLLYARDWLPTLVYVYDILYNVTPAAERERTERWLRQMTSTLARQDVWERWKNTTHGSWQAAALGVVGAALQDDAMLALAEKRIRYQMQTLLGPEGFWAGGSLTLHYTATRAFLAYAEATLHNKVSAYSWCNTRGESYIKSAVTAPLMLLDPFAEIPGNDHAETKTVPPDMCLIGALRFNDALLASIAFSQTTNVDEETLLMYFKLPDKIVRPQARPPHSVICPTLGWAVLRTGIAAPDKDLYARLDYGPQGDETGHADKLDLYFCGNGRRVMSCD
ncbi:hypothetical protein GX586_13445, partial [bacterium]|nr:hypothetical protein [bacterium]